MKSRYTLTDLKRNRKLYDENFNMLVKTAGTPEQDKYIKIERILQKESGRIMECLGTNRQFVKEISELKELFQDKICLKNRLF